MNIFRFRTAATLLAGSAMLLVAGTAGAQPAEGNSVIGRPELRDFQLEPRNRIVTQPTPAPAPPAAAESQPTAPAPAQQRAAQQPAAQRPAGQRVAAQQPAAQQPSAAPAAAQSATRPSTQPIPAPAPVAAAPVQTSAQPFAESDSPLPPRDAVPPAPTPILTPPTAPAAAPALGEGGLPLWAWFLAFVTVGLLGYGYHLRRSASGRQAFAGPAPTPLPVVPAAPPVPRPDPLPRPWIEVDIMPERATVDLEETVVEFEMVVRNAGGSEARNVRLQARMFPSTAAQDKELSDYFRSDEKQYRTIPIPPLSAGQELSIRGSVDLPRDRLKALQVDGKLLFIPLIGVNARYEWSRSRSGQTSRSWIVGREQPQPADRMAPFRLDLGKRVYRTIGKREHKVARRV